MSADSKYQACIERLSEQIDAAQSIVIGVGEAMRAQAGLGFYTQRDETFNRVFSPYADVYGFRTVDQGLSNVSGTSEVRWAFLAAHYCELERRPAPRAYEDLCAILEGKRFHIVTLTADFQLSKVFDDENISSIQGDYRYLQCFHSCHDKLYPAKPVMEKLFEATEGCSIPSELVPHCEKCGTELEPWVGGYSFLEGEQYKAEYGKWEEFILESQQDTVLFMEMGIGRKRKELIRQPFRQFAFGWGERGYYASISPSNALVPMELEERGVAVEHSEAEVLADVRAALGR